MRHGIYRHAILEFDSSATQPANFEDKLLLHDLEDSKQKPSWQIEVSVLNSSAAQFCLHQTASICKKLVPNSFQFRKSADEVRLEQVELQKRVLMNPMSSVYQAASKSRSESFLLDSEYSWVDWERGIIRSQFQDDRTLLRHSRNSHCLAIPESEP